MLSRLYRQWSTRCSAQYVNKVQRYKPALSNLSVARRVRLSGSRAGLRFQRWKLLRAYPCSDRARQPFRPDVERQRGFSLVEISIVTAIVLLLAIIAIPAVGAYVIENKVPRVGEELARFVLQVQINAQPGNNAPYIDISTNHLARMAEGSTVLSVRESGSTTTITHGLGSDGVISVAPSGSGASFTLTLTNVSHAACPALASVMQRVMDDIVIQSKGGSAGTVKSASVPYNALQAESSCGRGDVNTFELTAS